MFHEYEDFESGDKVVYDKDEWFDNQSTLRYGEAIKFDPVSRQILIMDEDGETFWADPRFQLRHADGNYSDD